MFAFFISPIRAAVTVFFLPRQKFVYRHKPGTASLHSTFKPPGPSSFLDQNMFVSNYPSAAYVLALVRETEVHIYTKQQTKSVLS
jgi:hypothetical protein